MKKFDSKNINRRGADAYMDVGGRAMHGAIAEALSFFWLFMFLAAANKFAATLIASPTINDFLCVSAPPR